MVAEQALNEAQRNLSGCWSQPHVTWHVQGLQFSWMTTKGQWLASSRRMSPLPLGQCMTRSFSDKYNILQREFYWNVRLWPFSFFFFSFFLYIETRVIAADLCCLLGTNTEAHCLRCQLGTNHVWPQCTKALLCPNSGEKSRIFPHRSLGKEAWAGHLWDLESPFFLLGWAGDQLDWHRSSEAWLLWQPPCQVGPCRATSFLGMPSLGSCKPPPYRAREHIGI
jgi:hypothetical protein